MSAGPSTPSTPATIRRSARLASASSSSPAGSSNASPSSEASPSAAPATHHKSTPSKRKRKSSVKSVAPRSKRSKSNAVTAQPATAAAAAAETTAPDDQMDVDNDDETAFEAAQQRLLELRIQHLQLHTKATFQLVVGEPSDGSTIEWSGPDLMKRYNDYAKAKLASHRQALERAPTTAAGRAVTHVHQTLSASPNLMRVLVDQNLVQHRLLSEAAAQRQERQAAVLPPLPPQVLSALDTPSQHDAPPPVPLTTTNGTTSSALTIPTTTNSVAAQPDVRNTLSLGDRRPGEYVSFSHDLLVRVAHQSLADAPLPLQLPPSASPASALAPVELETWAESVNSTVVPFPHNSSFQVGDCIYRVNGASLTEANNRKDMTFTGIGHLGGLIEKSVNSFSLRGMLVPPIYLWPNRLRVHFETLRKNWSAWRYASMLCAAFVASKGISADNVCGPSGAVVRKQVCDSLALFCGSQGFKYLEKKGRSVAREIESSGVDFDDPVVGGFNAMVTFLTPNATTAASP